MPSRTLSRNNRAAARGYWRLRPWVASSPRRQATVSDPTVSDPDPLPWRLVPLTPKAHLRRRQRYSATLLPLLLLLLLPLLLLLLLPLLLPLWAPTAILPAAPPAQPSVQRHVPPAPHEPLASPKVVANLAKPNLATPRLREVALAPLWPPLRPPLHPLLAVLARLL